MRGIGDFVRKADDQQFEDESWNLVMMKLSRHEKVICEMIESGSSAFHERMKKK